MARNSRRKKAGSHANHERWLVSYADFITLLFAFFVVMFASTQTDRTKAKAVSDAVRRALEHENAPEMAKVSIILGGVADDKGQGNAQMHGPGGQNYLSSNEPKSSEALSSSLRILNTDLKREIQEGTVQMRLESRGLIIGLNTSTFFPSGDDRIDPSMYEVVAKVAEVLTKLPNSLRLEGNTDSVPISTPRFQSNWELSAARSIAMLRILNERFGIPRKRMSIVGYADTNALASNQTNEGRKRNRRVDVVIVSDFGMREEPKALAH